MILSGYNLLQSRITKKLFIISHCVEKLYQISLIPFAPISGCADGREHAYSIHKRSRNFNVYSFNKKKTVLVPSNKAMF